MPLSSGASTRLSPWLAVVVDGIYDYEDDLLAVLMNCTAPAMMAKLKDENDCAGVVSIRCMRDMVFPDLPAPLPRNAPTLPNSSSNSSTSRNLVNSSITRYRGWGIQDLWHLISDPLCLLLTTHVNLLSVAAAESSEIRLQNGVTATLAP
ncbi:hypothetical protein PS1_038134 [Malus domestica]